MRAKPSAASPARPRRIAIVGTRSPTRAQLETVRWLIENLDDHDAVIVTGCARGVDDHARRCALNAGHEVVVCHAAWERLGKQAGPSRNTLIADIADECYAFPGEGPGTRNTIQQFKARGKKVTLPEVP